MVMSAIMRARRSLIGLSLIEGSCPEVGVLEPSILRTGRPPRHRLSISRLARSSPLAPLARSALPRERVRSMTQSHRRWLVFAVIHGRHVFDPTAFERQYSSRQILTPFLGHSPPTEAT